MDYQQTDLVEGAGQVVMATGQQLVGGQTVMMGVTEVCSVLVSRKCVYVCMLCIGSEGRQSVYPSSGSGEAQSHCAVLW